MSEDPYLAGVIATEQVKGIQSRGTHAMIKHFVTNDDEGGQISNAGRRRRGFPLERCTRSICSPSRWRSRTGTPRLLMCAFPHLNWRLGLREPGAMVKTLREAVGLQGLRRERPAGRAQHGGIDPRPAWQSSSTRGRSSTRPTRSWRARGWRDHGSRHRRAAPRPLPEDVRVRTFR